MRLVENDVNHTFVSKTPAMRGFSGLASRHLRRYAEDKVLVQEVTGARRLWFSSSIGIVDRSERCFEVLSARAAVLGAAPLVLNPRTTRREGLPSHGRTGDKCDAVIPSLPAAMQVNSFEVVTYRPTRLTLRVDVPDAGWLLVTDTWSHRWRVTVNGAESELFLGNFAFRAGNVSAGTSVVDFRYDPIGFPWLLMLSWGVLFIVGAWSVAAVVPVRSFGGLREGPH